MTFDGTLKSAGYIMYYFRCETAVNTGDLCATALDWINDINSVLLVVWSGGTGPSNVNVVPPAPSLAVLLPIYLAGHRPKLWLAGLGRDFPVWCPD